MTVLSVDELRARLGQVSQLDSGKEGQLQKALDTAAEAVGRWCGPLEPEPRSLTVEMTNGSLVLPVRPVRSVTALFSPQGYARLPDIAGSDLDAGIVAVRGGCGGRWRVTVSTGWDPAPAPLIDAAYIVAAWLWSTHFRGGRGTGNPLMGDGDVQLAGFAIPRQADELMAPYKIR